MERHRINVGILAACLPALRPLFAWILETASAFKSTRRGTALGSSNSNKYYRQKEGHIMDNLPARSTIALGQKGYKITVVGGSRGSDEEEAIIKRQLSRASSGPMSRLEQSITEADSEKEEEDLPIKMDRRFRVRLSSDRDFNFKPPQPAGILRTTEVIVSR